MTLIEDELRPYANRILWVARLGCRNFLPAVLGTVALNLIGVSTAALSVGGVILYAQHAESGQPIQLIGLSLTVGSSMMSLIGYGLIVALIGIISGICLFLAEWHIQRATRGMQKFGARRVLSIAHESQFRGWPDLIGGNPRQALMRFMSVSARFTAFTFRDLLRLVLPFLTFVFTVAVLFYVDSWFTAMLIPLAAVYLVPLYFINRKVADNQRDYFARSPDVRSRLGLTLRQRLESGATLPLTALDDSTADSDSYDRMMAAFYGRMIADKRAQFLNTVYFVVCLCALLVYFGTQAMQQERPLSDLLVYLVALRFSVSALRQVSGIMVKFSRFFPEVSRFTRFIDACDALASRRRKLASPDTSLPDSLTFQVDAGAQWGAPSELSVDRGSTLFVIVPDAPTFIELETIAARLESRLRDPYDIASQAVVIMGDKTGDSAIETQDGNTVIVASITDSSTARWKTIQQATVRGYSVVVTSAVEAVNDCAAGLPENSTPGVMVMADRKIIGAGDLAWLRTHAHEVTQALTQYRRNYEATASDEDDLDEME